MARKKQNRATHNTRGSEGPTKVQYVPHILPEPRVTGLRERKRLRLRGQIIETSVELFRRRGYENTRVDDIIAVLEISQPTFFRYFPSKDALLREVGGLGYRRIKEQFEHELPSDVSTAERIRGMYETMAKEVERNRSLWRAVVLSGAIDPLCSPGMHEPEEVITSLLREILTEGQRRDEITRSFSARHLAEFMEALYVGVIRFWVVDFESTHGLTERVRRVVEFFLHATRKSSRGLGFAGSLPEAIRDASDSPHHSQAHSYGDAACAAPTGEPEI
jgi:AcrR family transcriptional regulator